LETDANKYTKTIQIDQATKPKQPKRPVDGSFWPDNSMYLDWCVYIHSWL